ncbi:unnamed protein product [Cuscuta campestris]|uniref:RNase H type-1 domain-containing protein n=1 Tax=Cuscuta campestris TaxID=132261 RepID=A0A484MMI8_9ASTE|nr:unnamed protein product [Cuscuta campestris]
MPNNEQENVHTKASSFSPPIQNEPVNPQNIPQNDQNVGGQPDAMLPTLMVNFLQQMTHAPMFQPPPPPLRLITFKTLKDNGVEEFLGDRIAEPHITLEWIEQTARVLQNLNIPLVDHQKFASQLLRKKAYEWWKRTDENPNTPKPWTWEFFDWAFKKENIPAQFCEEKRAEFIELKQGDMTLPEYQQRFVHLAQFAPTLGSTAVDRIEEFRKRLRPDLRPHVSTIQTMDFIEAYDLISKADKDLSDYYESLKTEKHEESLKNFLVRWRKESREVEGTDDKSRLAMFMVALQDGLLLTDLTTHPPDTFEEAMVRAGRYVTLEERKEEKKEKTPKEEEKVGNKKGRWLRMGSVEKGRWPRPRPGRNATLDLRTKRKIQNPRHTDRRGTMGVITSLVGTLVEIRPQVGKSGLVRRWSIRWRPLPNRKATKQPIRYDTQVGEVTAQLLRAEERRPRVEVAGDVEEVELEPGMPGRLVRIGKSLGTELRSRVISVLRRFRKVFAWSPTDMPGFQFRVSNNEAKYEALINGLKILGKLGVSRVQGYSDSRLVVGQISGEFEAKGERMKRYRYLSLEMLGRFEYKLEHIPRAHNAEADVLSKLSAESPEYVSKLATVEELATPSLNRDEVLWVSVDPPEWLDRLARYIEDGVAPEDPQEAWLLRMRAPTYKVQEGILYKRSYNGVLLRCLRAVEARALMEEIHEGVCAAHQGPYSISIKAIIQGYFWPTMRKDCEEYERKCPTYQQF